METLSIPHLFAALLLLNMGAAAPSSTRRDAALKDYLSLLGYLDDPNNATSLTAGLRRLQKFAGVPVTGIVDARTEELLRTPRCGVRDREWAGTAGKYVLAGLRWRKRNLRYRVHNYPLLVAPAIVEEEVRRAFALWSAHAPLTFTRVGAGVPADIAVAWAGGYHGDGQPFDGVGGVLAHAFFPEDGRVHMDSDEHWTAGSHWGTNLYQTLAHELGHALGLHHSQVPGALMAPYYSGYQAGRGLHADDVAAIQALYGKHYGNLKANTSDVTTTRKP